MLSSLYQLLSPERRDQLRSKYEIISPDKLGSGSYGLVYAGLNKVTSKKVAIKNIKNLILDNFTKLNQIIIIFKNNLIFFI